MKNAGVIGLWSYHCSLRWWVR